MWGRVVNKVAQLTKGQLGCQPVSYWLWVSFHFPINGYLNEVSRGRQVGAFWSCVMQGGGCCPLLSWETSKEEANRPLILGRGDNLLGGRQKSRKGIQY